MHAVLLCSIPASPCFPLHSSGLPLGAGLRGVRQAGQPLGQRPGRRRVPAPLPAQLGPAAPPGEPGEGGDSIPHPPRCHPGVTAVCPTRP